MEVVTLAWLFWTSFKRNWFRYRLALIGLAAAVAVACVGISGSALMRHWAKRPLLQFIGGELMLVDANVQFVASGISLRSQGGVEAFSLQALESFVQKKVPGAKLSATMAAAAVQEVGGGMLPGMVMGRLDQTENWIYAANILEGRDLAPEDEGQLCIVVPGTAKGSSTWGEAVGETRTIRVASITDAEGAGALAAAPAHAFEIVGTYSLPSHNNTVVPFSTLQQLTGVTDEIHWAGLAVANPLELEASKKSVAAALAESMPELQLFSADDLGRMMIADFDRLQQTASYYAPVMIMASVLVVIVTALAISHSRRRELVLMRTVGVNAAATRYLLVVECTLVACLAALVGTGVAVLLGLIMFRGFLLNLIPGIAAILVTLLVSFLISMRQPDRLTELLRNP